MDMSVSLCLSSDQKFPLGKVLDLVQKGEVEEEKESFFFVRAGMITELQSYRVQSPGPLQVLDSEHLH